MRDEKLQRPGKEAAGSRHEPGVVRQTAPAEGESIAPQTQQLMEEVLRRENLFAALRRVQANKGAPGVDGMSVDELPEYLRQAWPAIREQLLSETYVPAPVRAVYLPKPGGGTRMLGIPTALDRLIAQAMLQVLVPIFDPDFSERSYGFRPGRSAHQALEQACRDMADGYRWVVNLDLEKFFDSVQHDIVMSRVARKVKDKRLLRLIRRYLNAGIMQEGLVSQREAGMPQGSPLSPLLSNILLDDLDKELERRGHRYCRYADDAHVYVHSKRAGLRVMASLTRFLETRLRLKVNRAKSVVDRPWNGTFLGYTVTNNLKPRLKPAPKSVKRAKDRIRQITHKGRGQNIGRVIAEINRFTRGWVGYFRLASVKAQFDTLDQWIRRRLRKILWEQWRTPKTRCRKLLALGLEVARARKATATGLGAWWNAGASHMHAAINNGVLAEWGLRSLLDQFRAMQRST
jgi:group II intron reverse transcriptase/maturase